MATAPVFPNTVINTPVVVNNASGTGVVTVLTASANGARIDSLNFTSTDTIPHDVQILVGGQLVGTISVAAGAGNTSTVSAKNALTDPNLPMAVTDPYGNKVIYVAGAQVLAVQMAVVVTTAKQIVVSAMGGGF